MEGVKQNIMWRVYGVYAVVVLFALLVFGQVVRVQIFEGAKWRDKSENATLQYRNIEAIRGDIYSVNNSLLATSVPFFEVRFDALTPAITDGVFEAKKDSLAFMLSGLFRDRSESEYRRLLNKARKNGNRYQLIQKNVKYLQVKELKTFPIFRKGQYKGGLILIQKNRRTKPFDLLASRTVGYEKQSGVKVGLEGAYSTELKGVSGKRLMRKLSGGVWMPIGDENEVDPVDGLDIYTTIDENIQDVAESALLSQLEAQSADHGCVVLMEVATGDVKAIANLQRTKSGKYYEGYNYAVGESTEPGSVFKLPAIMVALDDGLLDLTDSVDTEDGTTKFYDQVMYDSHIGGFGKISLQKAFEVSSNVGISKLIQKVYASDYDRFAKKLNEMGLNTKLGLEIVGEGTPLVKNKDDESWSGTTLPWMSIGYEVRQTPLQTLSFYNAVANDGVFVKPRFVRSMGYRGERRQENEVEVLNKQICSKDVVKKAQQMLEGVVASGTARNLRAANFKIAGKTGTAQIANASYGYKYDAKVSYQASFVGYFPADKPKYSCIVVVNAPSKDVYYGNLVAGPIFKEVADKVYAQSISLHDELVASADVEYPYPFAKNGASEDFVNIYSKLSLPVSSYKLTESNWVKVSTGQDTISVSGMVGDNGLVPNVVGWSVRDAVYLLENMGIDVRLKGVGVVKTQSLPAGERLHKNKIMILELA